MSCPIPSMSCRYGATNGLCIPAVETDSARVPDQLPPEHFVSAGRVAVNAGNVRQSGNTMGEVTGGMKYSQLLCLSNRVSVLYCPVSSNATCIRLNPSMKLDLK